MNRYGGKQMIPAAFCVGILLGTAFANLLSREYLSVLSGLLSETRDLLDGPGAARQGYFFYLLRVRGVPLLVLWAGLLGPYGRECLCTAALWYGICAGAALSGAVLLWGAGGVLVFLAAVLPQYIPYTAVFLQLSARAERSGRTRYARAGGISAEIPFFLSGAVIFLCGVLAEAYLNPFLLRLAALLV